MAPPSARSSLRSSHGPSHDEVLERRLAAVRGDVDAEPVPELPDPGRHASRRPWSRWSAVPVWLGPTQLAVVAVLLAVTLSLTAWWVVRSDARAVSAPGQSEGVEPAAELVALTPAAAGSPVVPSAGAVPGAVAGGSGTGGTDDEVAGGGAQPVGEVLVDVAGDVRRPGVVSLPGGSRVVDALESAGGARPGTDLTGLNLARVLVDGEQVLVGEPGAPVPGAPVPGAPVGAVPGAAASAVPGAPATPVDLNTADLVALETLPQVGPVTAQAIVTWREQNGGFTAVEELLEVDGIGEVTLAQIAPHATV